MPYKVAHDLALVVRLLNPQSKLNCCGCERKVWHILFADQIWTPLEQPYRTSYLRGREAQNCTLQSLETTFRATSPLRG
jgi:hypothetical protein